MLQSDDPPRLVTFRDRNWPGFLIPHTFGTAAFGVLCGASMLLLPADRPKMTARLRWPLGAFGSASGLTSVVIVIVCLVGGSSSPPVGTGWTSDPSNSSQSHVVPFDNATPVVLFPPDGPAVSVGPGPDTTQPYALSFTVGGSAPCAYDDILPEMNAAEVQDFYGSFEETDGTFYEVQVTNVGGSTVSIIGWKATNITLGTGCLTAKWTTSPENVPP